MAKLIPIYRKVDKEQIGYSLLMNLESQQVYKVEHGRVNQYTFWITWALLLALMRGVKDIHLSMTNLIHIFIVIVLIIISGWIGIYKYKKKYKDRYEVYYKDFLIKEYIREGEELLKKGKDYSSYFYYICCSNGLVFNFWMDD